MKLLIKKALLNSYVLQICLDDGWAVILFWFLNTDTELTCPILICLDEEFIERKSLAAYDYNNIYSIYPKTTNAR